MITLITYNLQRYKFASSRRAAPTASTSPRTSPAASGSTGRPSSPSPGSSGTGSKSNQPQLFNELFYLLTCIEGTRRCDACCSTTGCTRATRCSSSTRSSRRSRGSSCGREEERRQKFQVSHICWCRTFADFQLPP